jgi:hypothetical protein
VRNRPLNFIAGNRGISLGTPVARNPCTSSGDSRVSSACSSAGVDVTLRCPFYFLAYFFYFLATFFTFQLTFYINVTYTLLFFLLLRVLYQSTFFTNLASKKKVEGITYLAFLQKSKKKHEKVRKVNIGFPDGPAFPH